MSEDWEIELHESGGVVGRKLIYRANLSALPAHLRKLIRNWAFAGENVLASGAMPGTPTSELFANVDGSIRRIDTRLVDPDELEELFGELRSSPVVTRRS